MRSSSPSRTRSSTCASGAQIAELVHLVVPRPLGAEVRARRMRRVEHVGHERLRPRMPVEPGADELAVVVPAVARIGRGVDRQHREAAGAHPFEDRGALLVAPRRLADREERERAGGAELGRTQRPRTSSTRWGARPCSSRDLRDADRGLVEHAVHPGRPVGVGRDLRDEEQTIGHGERRYSVYLFTRSRRASGTGTPRSGRCARATDTGGARSATARRPAGARRGTRRTRSSSARSPTPGATRT